MTRAWILFLIAAMLTGCGKTKPTAPPVDELREAAILMSVADFKAELASLSKSHPELGGVEQFDHTHLGFTFVNDNVRPRIRLALSVEDGTLSEMRSVPVGAEELPRERIVCALQLECESRPEMKTAIEKAYTRFKMVLSEKLAEASSNKPDARDGL